MGKKILVVDDNEIDLLIIRRYLIQAGDLDVITAGDAGDGIQKAKAEQPDLVVLDTLLPGTSGFEVCQALRRQFGPQHPKIVIVTGSIDAVDAVKARKVGADDYCAKTSDCAPLLEAIKKLM